MKSNYKTIDELVVRIDERNTNNDDIPLLGLSIDKCFIASVANTIGTDLSKYKRIYKKDFAVSLMQVSRDSKIPIACLKEYDMAIMSPAYLIFRVKDKNVILPEYLEMWFKRNEFDREAAFIAVGGVRGSMPWSEFAMMKVAVPSIEKQKKIVKSYKVISDRIELKRKINDNLDATIQAVFDKLLCESGIILAETIIKQNQPPADWIDSTIGQYASVQTGPFGSQLHNEDYVDEGTPIITVEHMDGKYIAHRSLPRVSADDVRRLCKYDLHVGDIVFSRVGSVDRAVMVTQYENGWLFSGRCLRVRPNNSRLGGYFLWWFNQAVIKQLIRASAVGATMPSINTSILSNIRLLLPPEDLLMAFCNIADSFVSTIATNLAEIRKLENMMAHLQSSISH